MCWTSLFYLMRNYNNSNRHACMFYMCVCLQYVWTSHTHTYGLVSTLMPHDTFAIILYGINITFYACTWTSLWHDTTFSIVYVQLYIHWKCSDFSGTFKIDSSCPVHQVQGRTYPYYCGSKARAPGEFDPPSPVPDNCDW